MRKNLNKQFGWNGVILSVQSRSLFPHEKNLINKALKLSAAFFHSSETVYLKIFLILLFHSCLIYSNVFSHLLFSV